MENTLKTALQIFGFSAIRYFLLAGIPFLLFYVLFSDRLKPSKIQQKLSAKKELIREIWHSMQSTLVFSLISVLVLFTPLRQYTLIYSEISIYGTWYIMLSVAIALIIHDTYFYWMHRLLHHKKIFSYAHLVHHKSTNPSPWTSYSFHFLEAIAEGVILVIIVFALPLHPISIILFTIVGFAINVYGHLGYEIAPKWFRHSMLFEVFNSSVHHNLHHSKFKGNYGLYFRLWDRVMGTEHKDYVKLYDKIQEQRFRVEAKRGSRK